MEVGKVVQEEMVFRGVEFAVKVVLEEGLLIVEISDVATADQWRGEFDPAYIEDLTRKTGNFKQFPIFCSMLESAVSKVLDFLVILQVNEPDQKHALRKALFGGDGIRQHVCLRHLTQRTVTVIGLLYHEANGNTHESVTLDLLTYSDLELLRNRKAGVVGRPRAQQQCPALSAKRYLILIYTVEFDRIHYPLPLPYLGKPDPAALQKEIRSLRVELDALRSRGDQRTSDQETQRLRAELALVTEEKEALARALGRLEVLGPSSAPAGACGLREAVRNLEEQLLRERAKSQRSASKRGQEMCLLMEQLAEVRASERALRIRVMSLTNELALLKRGMTPVPSGHSSSRNDGQLQRSGSRDRSLGRVGLRRHSGSRERMDNSAGSTDRGRRAGSSGSHNYIRRPSPSPTGSRAPRFDPTAYIHDRQQRQREAELRNQRKIRRDMLPLPSQMERGRSRSREPCSQLIKGGSAGRGRSVSLESRSRQSSENSWADFEELAKPLPNRGRKLTYNGPVMTRGRHLSKKPMCSTPTQRLKAADRESSIGTGADLSEIDARLQALQDYMRELDTGH